MSHWSKIYMVSHKCSQVFPLPKSYKCFHSAEKKPWSLELKQKKINLLKWYFLLNPLFKITSTNISIPNLKRIEGDKNQPCVSPSVKHECFSCNLLISCQVNKVNSPVCPTSILHGRQKGCAKTAQPTLINNYE